MNRKALSVLLGILLLLCFITTTVTAGNYVYTLIDADTVSGDGAAATTTQNLGGAYKNFTYCVSWGASTPTTTTTIIEGSIDGTTYFTMEERNIATTTNACFPLSTSTVQYIRGNFTASTTNQTATGSAIVTIKAITGRD